MNLIFELTIIITLATLLGFLVRALKQPLLVAYLGAGAILAYLGFFNNLNQETFRLFADLGIMFLLFLVGLEINYKSLKIVGKTSVIVGIGQIVFTALIGFLIARLFGLPFIAAAYVSTALTFSSTIIIVKLLSDKKDTQSLYGKISIGFLLVQDMVAILLLIFLSSLDASNVSFNPIAILISLGKGIGIFALVMFLGYKIVPKVFNVFSHSQELLFLASTAWVFVIVSAVYTLGFSIEIAGFLAGLALANSAEHFQIANKIRPLRDFFVLLFFIMLGGSFLVSGISEIIMPVIVFSLFVLIGNPLIVLIIMGLMGYRKRTSFLAGITVAQISEFSLILAARGQQLGHLSDQNVALITVVGIITITLSSYIVVYANQIFEFLSPALSLFERKNPSDGILPSELIEKPIVLVGFHRTGKSLVHNLNKKDLLVIDFDPSMIKHLDEGGFTHLFGDIADPEVFEKAVTRLTKLIVSTSPDVHDNLALIAMLKRRKKRPNLIVRAETEHDAETLYAAGADYVIFPNLSAGHYLGKALEKNFKASTLIQLKNRDLQVLRHQKS